MKTLKKIVLLLSFTMVFLVGCNSEDKVYTQGSLKVDISKQIVYEQDVSSAKVKYTSSAK